MSKRRHHNTTDSKKYYDWLEMANEDIVCAFLLAQDDNCYNAAAFHCQQTIEKALKAYILLKSDCLVDGHNLTWLCKQAMKYDKSFRVWLEESASLNRCYIETRYPADIPLELSYTAVMGYCNMAKEMYLFICGEMDHAVAHHTVHPAQG